MTKHEAAVMSAFTGVLCAPFDVFHAYVEKIMERPVYTSELGEPAVADAIKVRARTDFLEICATLTD
jgi:hypothetical protein